VRTVAIRGGQPVEIDYRLYKTPQGWRLYDIKVLGVWLVQEKAFPPAVHVLMDQ
jgi:phospholipid transport system substrate-binding protein